MLSFPASTAAVTRAQLACQVCMNRDAGHDSAPVPGRPVQRQPGPCLLYAACDELCSSITVIDLPTIWRPASVARALVCCLRLAVCEPGRQSTPAGAAHHPGQAGTHVCVPHPRGANLDQRDQRVVVGAVVALRRDQHLREAKEGEDVFSPVWGLAEGAPRQHMMEPTRCTGGPSSARRRQHTTAPARSAVPQPPRHARFEEHTAGTQPPTSAAACWPARPRQRPLCCAPKQSRTMLPGPCHHISTPPCRPPRKSRPSGMCGTSTS